MVLDASCRYSTLGLIAVCRCDAPAPRSSKRQLEADFDSQRRLWKQKLDVKIAEFEELQQQATRGQRQLVLGSVGCGIRFHVETSMPCIQEEYRKTRYRFCFFQHSLGTADN